MKKFFYSFFVLAMTAMTFSSCEDVPTPYNLPSINGGDSEEAEPTGTGTAADPFNVAAAVKYIDEGGDAATNKYVKGKVVSVDAGSYDSNYGSLKYYISDDGTTKNQFRVYNGYAGPNRTKFSGEDALKAGDEVVICGSLTIVNGTKEFTTGNYVVSLNGQPIGGGDTPTTGEAKGTGTEADPFNSVAAQNYTAALAANQTTEQEFYIKGKIQKIDTQFAAQYGNASVHIADDANSQQFYIFRTYYFGGEKWKEGDGLLKEGDEIVVCAKLVNYMGNTPETSQGGKLISVNGKTSIEGGSETPDTPEKPDTPETNKGITISENIVTLTNNSATAAEGETVKIDLNTLGFTDGQTKPEVNVNGVTIQFDSNGQTTTPTFKTGTKGVRVYANNKVVFTGEKTIAKIVITCDKYNTTYYTGNESATVEFNGKTVTYINAFPQSGGTQLRIQTVEIFYAK